MRYTLGDYEPGLADTFCKGQEERDKNPKKQGENETKKIYYR